MPKVEISEETLKICKELLACDALGLEGYNERTVQVVRAIDEVDTALLSI